MPSMYTEADYENSVVELFCNMGYTHIYGPEIERDFNSPLYDTVLVDALHRLNKNLPEDAIADALFKLKNYENGELVQKNSIFMDYLQNGIPVRFVVNGEERSSICYLVDYANPDNNSFIGCDKRVECQQPQRGETVDQDIVILAAEGIHYSLHDELAIGEGGQGGADTGQFVVRGDEIHAFSVMKDR